MTDIEFRVDVVDRLARIETLLGAMTNHEGRIQSLEQGRSRWGGIIAAASVVLSVLVSYVTRRLLA